MGNETTGRYLAVIDPKLLKLKEASKMFAKRGVETVESLEILNTMVLSGDWESARKVADETPGIVSIEKEGIVRTQE